MSANDAPAQQSDGGLLEELRSRFPREIYTPLSSTDVLIAVNPFDDRIETRDTSLLTGLVARVRERMASGKPSVLLVAGQSGSGKTETTKLMLGHVFKEHAHGATMRHVISPLLESFGNAATTLNHNSSRFAKLVSLQMDDENRSVVNARVSTHLFERSRITSRPSSERNFHVFYELLAGMSKKDRLPFAAQLGIAGKKAGDFNLVRTTNMSISEAQDARNSDRTLRGLAEIGIDAFARRRLLRVLSSCLHLGELEFVSAPDDGTEIAPRCVASAQLAATLLGTSLNSLKFVLCFRRVNIGGGETIVANQTPELALRVRDSLIKELYSQCFSWIVEASNTGYTAAQKHSSMHFLDVMGFEVIAVNSMEQFCINYANERIHSVFCDKVIHAVESEYCAELGVGFAGVCCTDYDNRPLLDTFARLFAMLDEETILPRGSSLGFTTKALKLSNPLVQPVRFQTFQFSIKHYTGLVQYDSSQFLEKSVERVSEDLLAFVKTTKAPALTRALSGRTTGTAFKLELTSLMDVLANANVAFVRCIKANEAQIAGEFDGDLVARQLETSGVLAALRIARQAFPWRMPLTALRARYGPHLILAFPKSQLALGRTVAFLTNAAREVLERVGAVRHSVVARRIQRFVRQVVAARKAKAFKALVKATQTVQRAWRGYVARKQASARRNAAATLSRFGRRSVHRCRASVIRTAMRCERAEFEQRLGVVKSKAASRRAEKAVVQLQKSWKARRAAALAQKNQEVERLRRELAEERRRNLELKKEKERQVAELQVELARFRDGSRLPSPPAELKKTLGSLGEQIKADVARRRPPVLGGVLMLAQPQAPFAPKRRVETIADWALDAIELENDSFAENARATPSGPPLKKSVTPSVSRTVAPTVSAQCNGFSGRTVRTASLRQDLSPISPVSASSLGVGGFPPALQNWVISRDEAW